MQTQLATKSQPVRTYRVVSHDGVELARLRAASVTEVVASEEARAAPLGAEVVLDGSSRVVARREAWAGGAPGWSLV